MRTEGAVALAVVAAVLAGAAVTAVTAKKQRDPAVANGASGTEAPGLVLAEAGPVVANTMGGRRSLAWNPHRSGSVLQDDLEELMEDEG